LSFPIWKGAVPAPFLLQCLCCANGEEILDVSTNEGKFRLTVEAGEGDTISNMIMNQVEICQMMAGEGLKSVREI